MELKEMSLKELKKYDTYLFTIADIEVRDKEIERLKTELQDTKEHLGEYLHEQEEENKRLNNIINGMEKFFKYAYDNEVRPLNDRKVSVWTICLDKLQELKGVDKE